MSNRTTNLIAAGLLVLMFLLTFLSMRGDSATMDESAHIPAGYSYLSQKDFRLNPEHPPLIKDLAALPLLFLKLNFPKDHPSWQEGVNNQWWFGNVFLYQSGNDADKIILWARLPMILLLILLGWLIFYWARKLGGNIVGIFVLLLFAFSPTFLTHGRLVTTDVGATFGIVLATFFYLRFLKNTRKLNIILAGITFGIALLLKFSCVLLLPFFFIITLVFVLFNFEGWVNKIKNLARYLVFLILIGVIAVLVIYPVYYFHTLNYSQAKQIQDTKSILESSPLSSLLKLNIWMAKNSILRPLAHYFLGLLMATQRVGGGNTTYFLGKISSAGTWYYFPVVYLLKEPLGFHILAIIAFLIIVLAVKNSLNRNILKNIKSFFLNHFPEFSMVVFLAIYWITSIKGNLNLGVRHILPAFPFNYILITLVIKNKIKSFENITLKKTLILSIALFLGWYVASSISIYPHYLSYFNEIIGGPKNGYKFVVDSNYDWGQDLKRLKAFVDKKNIQKSMWIILEEETSLTI